ncbi:hypothetical protein [Vibrio diabolicus]|uniref:hypothetical protein n=1 Tax=Vibrio diabolicus TaxID=50719 RepID=UPI0038CD6D7F
MEYPIQLFVYLNEQDAEQTRIVSNVIKDTVQELNQLHGFKVDDWFLSSGRNSQIRRHQAIIANANLLTHKFALWALILNAIAYAYPIKCLSFEGQFNEVSRND